MVSCKPVPRAGVGAGIRTHPCGGSAASAGGGLGQRGGPPGHLRWGFPLRGQRSRNPRKGARSGGAATLDRCPLAPGPGPGETAGGGSARSQARPSFPGRVGCPRLPPGSPGAAGAGPGAARCRGEKPGGSPRPSRPFPAPPCGLRSFGGSPDSAEKCANRHTKKEDVNYCPRHTSTKKIFIFHLKFIFNWASCRFVRQPEAQAVPTQPQSPRRAPLGVGVAPARPPASFFPWGPSCPSCGAEDRAGRKNERVFRVWEPQVHWHPGTIPPTPAHSSGL